MRMLIAGCLVVLSLCAPALAGRVEDVGLRYTVPATWDRVPAASDMRAAQYRIPRAGGNADDGELVLFFFGKGQGGGVEDNLTRWYAQFTQPDGKSTKEKAVVTIRTVNGLKVTTVDVGGTYKPAPMGGGGGVSRPDWRMLGAIVEGPGGPWFFKATGPSETILGAKPDFDALIGSLEPHVR